MTRLNANRSRPEPVPALMGWVLILATLASVGLGVLAIYHIAEIIGRVCNPFLGGC